MTATSGTFDIPGLGRSVGRIILGTMTFGDQADKARADRILGTCLSAGVSMVDTASTYTGGRSEEILGELLRGRRDELTVCTKVGGGDTGPGGLSAGNLATTLDASLSRLQTDHVDVYYLHRPDRGTPADETVAAMGQLVASGKTRAWGVSNFSAWRTLELVHLADALSVPRPALSQPLYNVLSRRIEPDFVELTDRLGLPNVVYNPLAGGLLTGKYLDTTAAPPDVGRFANTSYRDRYWLNDHRVAVARLGEVAEQAGMSLLELALRWVIHRPAVSGVLVGASSPDQVSANLAALSEGDLPPDVLAACDLVWESLRGAAPAYAR